MKRAILFFLLAATAQAQIVNDTFTDSDNVLISNHTSDSGHSWVYVDDDDPSDEMRIETTEFAEWGGDVVLGSENSPHSHNDFAYIETNKSDVSVRVDYVQNDAVGTIVAGIVVRYSSSSNYWVAWTEVQNDGIRLYKVENGSLTLMDSDLTLVIDQAVYTLRVDTIEDTIRVYQDDVEYLEVVDTFNQTETKHGVYGYAGNSSVQYDDFQIFDLTPAPSVSAANVRRRGQARTIIRK